VFRALGREWMTTKLLYLKNGTCSSQMPSQTKVTSWGVSCLVKSTWKVRVRDIVDYIPWLLGYI
jgi:hypothetical protein